MHVALGELARVAPDALRGLGLSYPLADRATSMLVWGEAVHGLSLRFLAERGEWMKAATGTPFGLSTRQIGPLAIDELDAGGRSLLEAGPRALDLAQSRPDAGQAGLSIVGRTSGAFLAGELVERSLARGRSPVLVAFASGPDRDDFEGDGALLGLHAPGGDVVRALPLDALRADASAPLLRLLGLAGPAAAGLCEALDQFAAARSGEAGSRLAVLTVQEGADLAQERVETLGRLADLAPPVTPHWCAVVDFAARRGAAARTGLEIDEAHWRRLGAYVQRSRVVTSERSRSQAG